MAPARPSGRKGPRRSLDTEMGLRACAAPRAAPPPVPGLGVHVRATPGRDGGCSPHPNRLGRAKPRKSDSAGGVSWRAVPTIYLDHAATTPQDPAVRAAQEPYLGESFGNPSARHAGGVRAAEAMDRARGQLARALGARPEGVVFTSGGTEANNLAVLGLARAAGRRGHALVGPTEHPAVRGPAAALEEEGFEVERLRLTQGGELDLEDAGQRVRPDTVLVAQMLVQNEVGSIYPVARLAKLARARAPCVRVHVDAVQACGKLPCTLDELGADSIAVSAHKLGGPQGSGALVLRQGVEPRPLLIGGGQERGLRSGTQNVAGAVGLGAAI